MLRPEIKIIGKANPTMPLTTPATIATQKAAAQVDKSSSSNIMASVNTNDHGWLKISLAQLVQYNSSMSGIYIALQLRRDYNGFAGKGEFRHGT